jgi:methylglyoxal synthase
MRLQGVDPVLGVEMTSTGEVACIDYNFAGAYIKALTASNLIIPNPDKPILIVASNEEKRNVPQIVTKLNNMGYQILTTENTAEILKQSNIESYKILTTAQNDGGEGIINYLSKKKIGLVINTIPPNTSKSDSEGYLIRRTAVEFLIPVITRIETAQALVSALEQHNYGSMLRILCLDDLLKGAPLAKHL